MGGREKTATEREREREKEGFFVVSEREKGETDRYSESTRRNSLECVIEKI